MTPPRNIRRIVVSAVLLTAIVATAAPAHGLSALEGQVRQRARIVRTMREIRQVRWRTAAAMRHVVARSTRRLAGLAGRGAVANPHRFRHVQREVRKQRWQAAKRLEQLGPQVGAALATCRPGCGRSTPGSTRGASSGTARSAGGSRCPTTSASPCGSPTCPCPPHGQRHRRLLGHPDRRPVQRHRIGVVERARRPRGPGAGAPPGTCTTHICPPTAPWAGCGREPSSATWVTPATRRHPTTTSSGTRGAARRSIPTPTPQRQLRRIVTSHHAVV